MNELLTLKEKEDYYEQILRSVEDRISNSDKKTDKLLWMNESIASLLRTSLLIGQLEKPTNKIIECKRLIKAKRRIPKDFLYIHDYTPIIIDGLYIIVEGVMVPQSIMNSLVGRSNLLFPDKYKEWIDGYDYGVLKFTGDFGFTLKKSDLTKYYLNSTKSWEYFDLNLFAERYLS